MRGLGRGQSRSVAWAQQVRLQLELFTLRAVDALAWRREKGGQRKERRHREGREVIRRTS